MTIENLVKFAKSNGMMNHQFIDVINEYRTTQITTRDFDVDPPKLTPAQHRMIIELEDGEMTEELYQILNSLSLEDYDAVTSTNIQRKFCDYQYEHHPDEVKWYQVCNPD